MFYKFGDTFKWFMGRVVDIKDPKYLGRVKVRVINDQTGEMGKKNIVGGQMPKGLLDEDLLWAWPLSAVQSASLSWIKVKEMEEFETPDWIDAVGLSPTGIALSTYVFGFYLDGNEQNIPIIFGTYHKESRYPEPLTDIPTGDKSMLQLEVSPGPNYFYSDVAALAKGYFVDPDGKRAGVGQTLPKEPYTVSTLWKKNKKDQAVVDEFPTAYNTEYPYNTTYTTKSGHAIELDDTPSHERIHIWHKSGSYEEISNGPSPFLDGDTRSFDIKTDWPENGPAGFSYKTAGGVSEPDYKGRRSKKTMDTSFDVVGKDYNQLIMRDHNVEIANTESVKIGNTVHWTIGHKQNPENRINDNGKTDYPGGGLDKYSLHLDVLNNTIQTSGNNYVLGVGVTPESERRIDKSKTQSQSLYIDVTKDYSVFVGEDYRSITQGNRSETIEADYKLTSNTSLHMECLDGSIQMKGIGIALDTPSVGVLGSMNIKGALTVGTGVSGSITGIDGTTITFTAGIITGFG
jgi:hypothetical protein|tara:strand:- start:3582 stop:5126 length:1545 start_codon:yes stop_codon:yes gene_type:complete